MAGDPSNAAVWQNADVFIGSPDAVIPVDGSTGDPTGDAFGADWDAVGLLNGDDGFTESMDMDSDDFFAWGGILIATTRRNFKLTRSFTAYEDNETVMDLVYPGHTLTFDGNGGYAGDLPTPDLGKKFKIAFQVAQPGGLIKRVVSKNYAQIDERGEATESESDLQSRELTVAVYPDAEGVLFSTYKGPKVTAPVP